MIIIILYNIIFPLEKFVSTSDIHKNPKGGSAFLAMVGETRG
jgi:hypothetical protein